MARTQAALNPVEAVRALTPLSGASKNLEISGISEISEKEKAAIYEAASAFESYFIQMMLREMRKTIPEDKTFLPKSNAEKIFTDLLDEELAKEIANGRGMGLANHIVAQMTGAYSLNMR